MSLFLSNLALEEDGSPTFFELSMSTSLSKSFKPAFDYCVALVFDRNPNNWFASHLMIYRNEVLAFLLLLVERHYLKEFNSSFCENFYGLKRVQVSTTNGALPNALKLTSLLELVLVPYLCARYLRLMQAFEAVSLCFSFAYMFKQTKYFSPLHLLQGITLKRLDGEDLKRMAEANAAASKSFSLVEKASNALRMGIVASAVVFKIVEYYYSNENRAMREANQVQLRVPPPPQTYPLAQRRRDLRLCPLCGEARTDPALSTSGFCFCYACLAKHVAQTPFCPIVPTQPCSLQDIRKVFVV